MEMHPHNPGPARRKVVLPGLIALLVALISAACAGGVTSNTATENQEATGLQLPADFRLTLYQGEEVLGASTLSFSDVFAQGKPVVLNFWAGLCPPCRFEMPDFQRVYEAHQQDVIFLGLDVGPWPFVRLGTSEEGKALLQELHVTYPAGTSPPDVNVNANVFAAYGVLGLPSTVFLAPDGRVYKTWVNPLTEGKLTELIEELLEFSAASL